jgi:hypothetical protein
MTRFRRNNVLFVFDKGDLPLQLGLHVEWSNEDLYQKADQYVLLSEHPTHLEPLIAGAVFRTNRSAKIVPVLEPQRETKGDFQTIDLGIYDTKSILMNIQDFDSLFSRFSESLKVFWGLGGWVIALYPSSGRREAKSQLSFLGEADVEIDDLVLTERFRSPQRLLEKKRPYDPLRGKIDELEKRIQYAILHLDELTDKAWTRDSVLPAEDDSIDEVLGLARISLDGARAIMSQENAKDKDRGKNEIEQARLHQIHLVSGMMRAPEEIMYSLRQVWSPWKGSQNSLSLNGLEVLESRTAMFGVLREFLQHCGIDEEVSLVLVPSQIYTLKSLRFRSSIVVEVPEYWFLRAGLWPCLAYVAARYSLEYESADVLRTIVDEIMLTKSLGKRVSEEVPLEETISRAIADLIACEAVGPCYYYASTRVLTNLDYQSIYTRLDVGRFYLMKELLSAVGYNVRLQDLADEMFHALAEPWQDIYEEILRTFLGASKTMVARITMPSSQAIAKAKSSLLSDSTTDEPPTAVFNALWEAVFEPGSYANEQAIFLSLLQWSLKAHQKNQRIVPMKELEKWLSEGWLFVTKWKNDKAIIRQRLR